MTTIAFDSKIMVADSQITCGDHIEPEQGKKIGRVDGRIYGYAGEYSFMSKVHLWLSGGGDPGKAPVNKSDWEVIWHKTKSQYLFFHNRAHDWQIRKSPGAIGSGELYALAAMEAGADPKRAVQIACKFDTGSGGKIQVRPV